MTYVDGFLLVVPTKNLKAYRRMAEISGRVWRDHGALEYRECVGEDMQTKMGVPFPRVAKARRGEKVVFSWIVYRSRAHRDRVVAKVMKDPRMNEFLTDEPMPFDMKRLAYGGFETLVEL